jgi:hypothetical protein
MSVFITSANIKHLTDKLEECDNSAGKVACYWWKIPLRSIDVSLRQTDF